MTNTEELRAFIDGRPTFGERHGEDAAEYATDNNAWRRHLAVLLPRVSSFMQRANSEDSLGEADCVEALFLLADLLGSLNAAARYSYLFASRDDTGVWLEHGEWYASDDGRVWGPLSVVCAADNFDIAMFDAPQTEDYASPGSWWYRDGTSVDEGLDRDRPMIPSLVRRVDAPALRKEDVLDKVAAAVADRGLNYGKPEDNFERIAARWRAHLKNRYGIEPPIDGASVAVMMADVKLARIENQPAHLDSWVDLAGYAACGAELTKAR